MNILYKKLANQDYVAMSTIAQKAKSFWNYPEEWLQLWQSQLTFTAADVKNKWSCGAYIEENLVAFITLSQNKDVAEIDNLWVLPKFMKQGIGGKLMTEALLEAKNRRLEKIRIESDPNAEEFYKKYGAIRVGFVESIPKPRKIHLLEITLK